MMNDKNSPVYYTSELGLAGYLITIGHKMTIFDTTNQNRITFGFINNEQLDNDITEYLSGQSRIEPSLFYNNIKQLKMRINSAKTV